MPTHASKSNWTRMHVSESSWESCHCDHCLRLVSLLWLTLESRPERSRNVIYDHTAKIQWSCMRLVAWKCKHTRRHFMNIFLLKRRACIADDVVRCGSLALQSVHVGALSLHRLHVRPLLHGSRMTCHLCKLSATLGLHRLHVTHLLRRSGVTCNWCKAFGCMEMHPQACKASFHEVFFAEAQGLHCR